MREEEKRLAKLEGDVALLSVIVDAQRGLLDGICIALASKGAVPVAEMLETLEITAAHLAVARSRRSGATMLKMLATLRAIANNPRADPIRSMVIHILLDDAAGEDHRNALKSWIEQATPDELAHETQKLIQKLLDDPPA